MQYGILFMLSLLGEYIMLEHVHMHVLYRVNQARYVICIPAAAPQEYV